MEKMNLKIVYDNEAKAGFEKSWGFSCLIEIDREKTLFDVGWDGNILLSNLEKFEVNPEDIDKIVLSHAHWDHIGGLTDLLRIGMEIYVPKSFSEHLKSEIKSRLKMHEIKQMEEIGKGVWTTGELKNKIKEQSLVLDTDEGLIVLVGCSHPGVPKILNVASELGKVYGIIGGMHDFENYEVLEGLSLVVPTHCTSNKEEIANRFPEIYREGKVGMEIELPR